MSTRLTRVAVAVVAGASLLLGAAPLAEAAGPDRHSHRGHSHHRHSHGHRHHHHGHSHRHHSHHSHRHHYSYPGRSHYHGQYNPYRFHRPHYKSYHSSSFHCYPSYSISFGFDSCSSIYTYGTAYSYPAYTYSKVYDPYCRSYSSGVYLSYDSSGAPPSLTGGPTPPPVRIIDATNAGPTEIGFELLRAGEYSRALSFFADATSRDLNNAEAKLGYSLASAAQGQDDRAVWAMQNAMTEGAADLASRPVCRELTTLLNSLKARYQQQADRYVHTPDKRALFMVAAINHVQGDADGAKAALARAHPGGAGFYNPATKALAEALESGAVASSNSEPG